MSEHRVPVNRLRVASALGVVAVLAVAGAGVAATRQQGTQTDDATTRAQVSEQKAQRLADPIPGLCAVGDDTSRKLRDAHLCDLAAEVNSPTPVVIQGKRGDPGPGPTPEQIKAAVLAVLTDNPGLSRGRDGAPASQAQVEAAVAQYVTSHRDELQGKPGKDGTPGRDGERGPASTVTAPPATVTRPPATVTETAPPATVTQTPPPVTETATAPLLPLVK